MKDIDKKTTVIVVTSGKGGVGKTILTLNLAGIYEKLEKKVLLLDFDFTGGNLALNMNLTPQKSVYNVYEDLINNKFTDCRSYITKYSDFIDVVSSPKDPRQARKIEVEYIESIINIFKQDYDVVLIDTQHGLHGTNIVALDSADVILYTITNSLMDLKNTKAFMQVLDDVDYLDKVKVVLNNSARPELDYFSIYDMKNLIKHNIDYTISSNLYIKNFTKYVVEGKIFTLNKNLIFKDKKDLNKLTNMAKDLIK